MVNRTVNRYIDPQKYTSKTQERKLNYKTGDVVNLDTSLDINFDGSNSQTVRAQVISVKTNYTAFGRDYTSKFYSYEPIFVNDSEIIISGNVTDINLYIQYAGAPSQAVDLTFIFDGAIGGSSSSGIPAINAGNFAVGSKLTIILVNGADLQAKGGDGGNGGNDPTGGLPLNPTNGVGGGTVYNANGVDTDIYFSGATPSAIYPNADGYIRAPSGGSGGFNALPISLGAWTGGDGGNAGDGRSIGFGGLAGLPIAFNFKGSDGAVDGSKTGWGNDGANNDATGGLKGRGVADGGGVVTFFGDTPARYINGGGDH